MISSHSLHAGILCDAVYGACFLGSPGAGLAF
jgi:hypothetical protein